MSETRLGIDTWPDREDSSDYREWPIRQHLNRITMKRGMKVVVEAFPPETKERYLGLISPDGTIYINEDVPNWFKPFVLAHELGHLQLHANLDMTLYYSDKQMQRRVEAEADAFSKRLYKWVRWRMYGLD
ncbi:hypothetical protein SY88_09685 [Clostridiales bacterium PH28_bin88]|nr:hypothetical protein SY88_09685 [Clostridiales bacterium PH28_bin88]